MSSPREQPDLAALDRELCEMLEPMPPVPDYVPSGKMISPGGWWFISQVTYRHWNPTPVSRSGDTMLRVIDEMRERGYLINPRPLLDGYVATAWPAEWGTGHTHQHLGESLPHAVALAAREALTEMRDRAALAALRGEI